MNLYIFFALLGGLLVLAFIANRLVRFTHVPDVVILMATGVVIGPVMHWVNPDIFRGATHGFGSLALILILFEGGLDLKLREVLRHFGSGFFLSLFSYTLSGAAIAAACHFVFHFPRINALLIGGAMGCISSSILLPVLQQVRLRREVAVTLLVEASLGDAFGVLAVTTLLEIAAGGVAHPKAIAWAMGSSLILAIACGVLAGMLWSYLLPVLSEEHFWHVLTFAAVLLVYSGVHFLQGNELISVLFFGLTLSNFPTVRRRLHFDDEAGADWFNETPMRGRAGRAVEEHQNAQMLTFHGELAFLLRTFFFVLLGLLVDWAGLRDNILLALLCFAAILIARVVAVQTGRLAWRTFTRQERELMVWFVPRGLITAVLGIEILEVRGPAFEFLPSLAVAVILLTNLVLLIGTVRAQKLPPEEAAAPIAITESAAPAETA
jgi:cell volume regulation protein A